MHSEFTLNLLLVISNLVFLSDIQSTKLFFLLPESGVQRSQSFHFFEILQLLFKMVIKLKLLFQLKFTDLDFREYFVF